MASYYGQECVAAKRPFSDTFWPGQGGKLSMELALPVGTVAMVHAPAALAGAALRTVREVSAGFGRVIASTLRLPNLLARMV